MERRFEATGSDFGFDWRFDLAIDDDTDEVSYFLYVAQGGGGGSTSPLGSRLLDGFGVFIVGGEGGSVALISQVRPGFSVFAELDDDTTREAIMLAPTGFAVCFCILFLDRRPRRIIAVDRDGCAGEWITDPVPVDMPVGGEGARHAAPVGDARWFVRPRDPRLRVMKQVE